jgi:hypothetical protein
MSIIPYKCLIIQNVDAIFAIGILYSYMKPGRNDPCPCGSGKKYKKCCYLTGQNPEFMNLIKSKDFKDDFDDYEDDNDEFDDDNGNYDEQANFLTAVNNLRGFFLEEKPHIKKYYKIRKMHGEIISTMMQYYHDGKFEKQIDTDVIPGTEPTEPVETNLLESNFDLETRLGAHSFYDLLIYKMAPNVTCITDDFIRKNRYRSPEKIEFLHSMLASKLGLFEITGADMEEGYAYIKDVFTGAEYTIVDIGLSGNIKNDASYLYTRIISYQGINFGSGLNFNFQKTDNFIINHIREHKKDFDPKQEYLRFNQLYNRYSQDPNRVRVVINEL